MIRNLIGTGALILAVAIAAPGCGKKEGAAAGGVGVPPVIPQKLSPALLPAGQEMDYWPVAVGNQWTYEAVTTQAVNGRQTAPVKSTITYLVKKVTDGPNGRKFAQFDIKEGDKFLEAEVWQIDSKGLAQTALGAKLNKLSSPQYVVEFPVKVGAKNKWIGTVKDDKGQTRNLTMNWSVSGEEQIDTIGQSYNALALAGVGMMKQGSSVQAGVADRLWFVPKMGIVRRSQEMVAEITSTDPKTKGQKAQLAISRILRLKNFTPKK